MTNEEIKKKLGLMCEHLSKAQDIANELTADFNNYDKWGYNGPYILDISLLPSIFEATADDKKFFVIQLSNAYKIVDFDTFEIIEGDQAYPEKRSTKINGVKLYEIGNWPLNKNKGEEKK